MKSRYRVLHLIKSLGRGGAETLLAEGLRYADTNRFTYGYGYFLPWKNALVSTLRDSGAEVTCFDCRHRSTILLSVHRVTKFLKHWKADLIHCHLPLAGVVGRLSGRSLSIPVMYTEHNVWNRYHPLTRGVNRLTWKYQDQVIAVSKEVSDSILMHAGDSVPVTVVQNGIPVDSFTPSQVERQRIRKLWSIPDDGVVVGTVAVFRVQKDLHTWLKAARLIKNSRSNVQFLLVGDGPLRDELEKAASELGLQNSIHFTGLQENVSPYYSAMDIYVNSSIFEGLPLSILEAMATGIPLVATAVGGVPEVISDGTTGFLVSPNSPEQIAQKVLHLISNDELRSQFGQAARSVVEAQFGIKRMIKKLEDLYLDVLEKRRIVH